MCQGSTADECLMQDCKMYPKWMLSWYLDIYQAFISSNFNYCDIVWHFCSNHSTYKIEKFHKNALPVTLNDYTSSYSDMLEVVKRSILYISRFKNRAIETFKNVKGLNPKYEISFLIFNHALLYTWWVQISSTKSKYDLLWNKQLHLSRFQDME